MTEPSKPTEHATTQSFISAVKIGVLKQLQAEKLLTLEQLEELIKLQK